MEDVPMTLQILYGIRNVGIGETADALSVRLGCSFQVRESDYLGTYMFADQESAEVKVVSQPDPEGDPLEDEFEEYGTLVYVNVHGENPELDGILVANESLVRLRVEQ